MLASMADAALRGEPGIEFFGDVPTSQLRDSIEELSLDIVVVELEEIDNGGSGLLGLYQSLLTLKPGVSFLVVKEDSSQFFFLELNPTLREVSGKASQHVAKVLRQWRSLADRQVIHATQ